nr:MAG TPA: hypothetical protein [Caudoviricetes sp.]
MAGYLAKSATNTDGMSYDAMLYCKTNIGGYFFDGFITVDVTSELEITENPVETGAAIADHAYVKPTTIDMNIIMSDVHESLVAEQFTGGWSRSVKAYEILKQIQSDRIPVAVLTRVGLFENMLIKRIISNDDAKTYRGLNAQVSLVELPIARVRTVEISSAPQTTIDTEMGKINATTTTTQEDNSILYEMFGGGS